MADLVVVVVAAAAAAVVAAAPASSGRPRQARTKPRGRGRRQHGGFLLFDGCD